MTNVQQSCIIKDKKSEMILTNTLHNVRQRNIVYSKALRNVCQTLLIQIRFTMCDKETLF